jgi:hypothetical protein
VVHGQGSAIAERPVKGGGVDVPPILHAGWRGRVALQNKLVKLVVGLDVVDDGFEWLFAQWALRLDLHMDSKTRSVQPKSTSTIL